jgi:phospholipid/cholesterol/gamma-HCH transport system permease protein
MQRSEASGEPASSAASFRLERSGEHLRLEGDLRMHDAAAFWRDVHAQTADASVNVVLDLAGVRTADGGVVALVVELRRELEARGVKTELVGASGHVETIVALYGGYAHVPPRPKRKAEGILSHVGRMTLHVGDEARGILDFLGSMVIAGVTLVRHPRAGHWKEVAPLCEKAGADAVPIVLLINFLVGFVMAFQAARQLKMFGANIYVADLVGISLTRELAPLMTAIIVCGRSGAAFAAELGSMKVNEEIDALRSLGLTPFGWLVVPRVIALVLIVPVLTLLADFIGVMGGLLVAVTNLDLTARGYLVETLKALHGWDVVSGILKSVVFSVAIALIACQQGFSAEGGAEGVGKRTTSTVVTSLFAIVILDALLTMTFRAFDV